MHYIQKTLISGSYFNGIATVAVIRLAFIEWRQLFLSEGEIVELLYLLFVVIIFIVFLIFVVVLVPWLDEYPLYDGVFEASVKQRKVSIFDDATRLFHTPFTVACNVNLTESCKENENNIQFDNGYDGNSHSATFCSLQNESTKFRKFCISSVDKIPYVWP